MSEQEQKIEGKNTVKEETFSSLLTAHRLRNHLTQASISRDLDLTPAVVNRWVKGKDVPKQWYHFSALQEIFDLTDEETDELKKAAADYSPSQRVKEKVAGVITVRLTDGSKKIFYVKAPSNTVVKPLTEKDGRSFQRLLQQEVDDYLAHKDKVRKRFDARAPKS